MTWDDFVASAPGRPLVNAERYKTASVRSVPTLSDAAAVAGYVDTFRAWCIQAGGISPGVDPASQRFAEGAVAWSRTALARDRLRSLKTVATCSDASGARLIGAILLDRSRGFTGSSTYAPIYNPVVAYYDEDKAMAFAEHYVALERLRDAEAAKPAEQAPPRARAVRKPAEARRASSR